jgi:O-antigen/teichoic acid export membrane protein
MFFYFVYANICFELNKSLKNGIKIWKQYNGTNFILLFVLMLLFYVFSDEVFTYFKIEKSRIPQMSSYFKLGLIVPLLVSISQPLRQLMFAFNENKIYIKITIIATVLNFVLLSFLTKQNGLSGAFFSIILIEFIIIVLYLNILKKYFKENSTNEL